MMKDINKDFGFYGAVRCRFDNPEHVEMITFTAVRRMMQIQPNLSAVEITQILNSKTGRHMADELLDISGDVAPAVIMLRIAMWNKLSIHKWLLHYDGIAPVLPSVDTRMLYVSAIKNEMKKKSIRKLMIEKIGCEENSVWPDPETWVNAENVPTRELETMWQYIQAKLQTKGKRNGYN